MSNVDFYHLAEKDILPIIELSIVSARLKLNKQNRRYCFEIFGYDFMVDYQLKPWLIEVNTNPCLEEPNDLLRQLVPRMLDDAFKLTLDVLYPPIPNLKIYKPRDEPEEEAFPVDGYPNEENLWGSCFYRFRQ